MRPCILRPLLSAFLIALILPAAARAQIASGSDGGSGALTVSGAVQRNLALAVTGTVNDPGNPNGVYDPTQWAVVFEYTDVTINSGATLTFANHPSGAPVVWLVSGNVTINGTVNLDAANGASSGLAAGAPGGFRGGHRTLSSASPGGPGFGPGGGGVIYGVGGASGGASGSYGSAGGSNGGSGGPSCVGPTYGNSGILPLIGGSGGSGAPENTSLGGGGGGGALLIVCNNSITISGTLTAEGGDGQGGGGGSGGGSGGAFRLVANSISVGSSGTLRAIGGTGAATGGLGRLRAEANSWSFTGIATPSTVTGLFTIKTPLDVSDPVIFPALAPTVRIVSVDGVTVSVDPRAEMTTPPADVNLNSAGSIPIVLETTNAPTNSTVKLRVVPRQGNASRVAPYEIVATLSGGNQTLATWQATLTSIPAAGFSALQARVTLP